MCDCNLRGAILRAVTSREPTQEKRVGERRGEYQYETLIPDNCEGDRGEEKSRGSETLTGGRGWVRRKQRRAYYLEVIEVSRARVLAPTDVLQGGHVLLHKGAAFLVVVDALPPVAVLEALAEDLGLLDLDELLAHHVLALLQHGHGVGVRLGGVEVLRGRFLVELGVVALEHHGCGGLGRGPSETEEEAKRSSSNRSNKKQDANERWALRLETTKFTIVNHIQNESSFSSTTYSQVQ